MSRDIKATALRRAAKTGAPVAAYSSGRTALLILGARVNGDRVEGNVFEHQCESAGHATAVVHRVWQVWEAFPHLPPARALEQTADFITAERRVAARRMRRSA